MADRLDRILTSYVADGTDITKDKLLGAAFVVVSKYGRRRPHAGRRGLGPVHALVGDLAGIGDGWWYGTGPDWAGQALERTAGARLGGYMDEHVLGPLGLRGTTGFRVRELFARRGDGLYSSAADYGRVMQELLRALAGEEGTVVGRETSREMFRPQLDETQRQRLRNIVWTFGSAAEVPEGSHTLTTAWRDSFGSIPRRASAPSCLSTSSPYGDSAALALFGELEKAVYGKHVPAWKDGN
ncbi:hypothetical protein VTH06DRAFT_2350 [Thermothelomyces fergusii]